MDRKEQIKKYIDVLLITGLDLKKDEKIHVSISWKHQDFAVMFAKRAYELGAADVLIDFTDAMLDDLRSVNSDKEAVIATNEIAGKKRDQLMELDYRFVSLDSNDHSDLDLPTEKLAEINRRSLPFFSNYYDKLSEMAVIDLIANVPSKVWAKQIFKDLDEDTAYEKLWDLLLEVMMCNEEDPVEAWGNHTQELYDLAKKFTDKQYTKFLYKGPGIDLEVGMPKGYMMGGGALIIDGAKRTRNLPTAEVSSLPHKYQVNGYLKGTRPLVHENAFIDQFTMTFKDGKIVDYSAEVGYEHLKNLLETDEGSMYLGEIAFVPEDSIVAKAKTTFYDILFDENASCHFAFGSAYTAALPPSIGKTPEEQDAMGVNYSNIHIDFMIGSDELNVWGITPDGEKEAILVNGLWAKDL